MPIGKKKKHRNVADRDGDKELIFKDETGEQLYAIVQKSLGSSRFTLLCDDGTERIGRLRGKMRRSEWVSTGCVVLATTREGDAMKLDILMKYCDAHVRLLKKYGELHGFETVEARDDDIVDDTIDFEDI